MKSIKSIYKIGYGPSSSHTMGPAFATSRFMTENPEADFIKVILYGSLAKTGKGHGTDRGLLRMFLMSSFGIWKAKRPYTPTPSSLSLLKMKKKSLVSNFIVSAEEK